MLGLGLDAENDWDTIERLTQTQPRLPVIIAGAKSEGFAHPLASTAEALLEKPIDVSLLLDTLRGLCVAPSADTRTLLALADRKRFQFVVRFIHQDYPAVGRAPGNR